MAKCESSALIFYYQGYRLNLYRIQLSNLYDIYLSLCTLNVTKTSHANNLDPDETPSRSASHTDPSCLTLDPDFYQNLISDILYDFQDVTVESLRMRILL